jgi:hypothetical protein
LHNEELQLVLLVKYYYNAQDKEDEMGRVYSTHCRGVHVGLPSDSLDERDH